MNVLKYHLQWKLGHLQSEVRSIQITTTHGTPTTTMTRSLGFLLMAFIELSFEFMVPLITHRTIQLLLHSTFIFEAPLSNDYFKQANIEYRATKFTINGS